MDLQASWRQRQEPYNAIILYQQLNTEVDGRRYPRLLFRLNVAVYEQLGSKKAVGL